MEIKTETDSSDSAKCSQDGDQCAGTLVVSDAVFWRCRYYVYWSSVCPSVNT